MYSCNSSCDSTDSQRVLRIMRLWVLASLCVAMLSSFVTVPSQAWANVQTSASKPFLVSRVLKTSPATPKHIGTYDTFFDALNACIGSTPSKDNLKYQYYIDITRDCEISETESTHIAISYLHLLIRSQNNTENKTYTLTRKSAQESARGVLSLAKDATIEIENLVVDGSHTSTFGLIAESGHLIFGRRCVIQNFFDGGATYFSSALSLSEPSDPQQTPTLTIKDGALIQNNTAQNRVMYLPNETNVPKYGGFVQADAKTKIEIGKATFKNNSSEAGGGAIFTQGALICDGATFENNKVTSQNGVAGAILSMGTNTLSIKNTTFTSNTATTGGALAYTNPNAECERCTFSNNSATTGGAIATFTGVPTMLTLNTCTFSENKATNEGGALYLGWKKIDEGTGSGTSVAIRESNFSRNTAMWGGAIFDELYDYSDPADTGAWSNISIDKDMPQKTTVFTNNVAHKGYMNPPQNYADFTHLEGSALSTYMQGNAVRPSLINNMDINYKSSKTPSIPGVPIIEPPTPHAPESVNPAVGDDTTAAPTSNSISSDHQDSTRRLATPSVSRQGKRMHSAHIPQTSDPYEQIIFSLLLGVGICACGLAMMGRHRTAR